MDVLGREGWICEDLKMDSRLEGVKFRYTWSD